MNCSQPTDPDPAQDLSERADMERWLQAAGFSMQPETVPTVADDIENDSDDEEADAPATAASTAGAEYPADDELSEQRELLAFIAGFVAHKCRDLDRSLGEPISTAKPGPSVPVA